MHSPYSDLPKRAFWRSGVTDRPALEPGDLYNPKFNITRDMRIATAGSCFAQHVGRTLRNAGFNVLDTEPFPSTADDLTAQKFGYRLYSARYGNIYTTRQLMQMFEEMKGQFKPACPVWEKGGRYYDAMRPSVEPQGLDSEEQVLEHRKRHLTNVRKAFFNSDLVVFTFGLTEAWVHTESGTVYPTAPGTIAGTFDPSQFQFKNYRHHEVLADFLKFRKLMMKRNPEIKFMITTSPVPLTATASGQHVEVATSYSKSVLRAVCGELYEEFDNVDYFPSYEIITSANNRGVYFESNKRNVSMEGVAKAMSLFLNAHDSEGGAQNQPASSGSAPRKRQNAPKQELDNVCEDALLESFSK